MKYGALSAAALVFGPHLVVRAAVNLKEGRQSGGVDSDATPNLDAYSAISTKVDAFEAHIAAQEANFRSQLEADKARYEQRLTMKRHEILKLQMANDGLRRQAQDLAKENMELVRSAQELQAETEVWHDDWLSLKRNLSDAAELTSMTMETYRRQTNASELTVLRTLDNSDAIQLAERLHQTQLDEIMQVATEQENIVDSQRRTAYLQTARRTLKGEAAPDERVFKVLKGSLGALVRSHERQQEEMNASYAALFHELDGQFEGLTAEKRSLTEEVRTLRDVKERLTVATEHLQAVNNHLDERGKSIRAYTAHLAAPAISGRVRQVPPEAPSPDSRETRVGTRKTQPDQMTEFSRAHDRNVSELTPPRNSTQVPWMHWLKR